MEYTEYTRSTHGVLRTLAACRRAPELQQVECQRGGDMGARLVHPEQLAQQLGAEVRPEAPEPHQLQPPPPPPRQCGAPPTAAAQPS